MVNGGENLMFMGGSAYGPGNLVKVNDILKKTMILKQNIRQCAEELDLGIFTRKISTFARVKT